MYYYAPLQFLALQEDSQGLPYWQAGLVAKQCKDKNGEVVHNPATFVIYGAKGVKEGDIRKSLVRSRGAEGIFDVVKKDQVQEVLEILEVSDIKELDIPPVRAYESAEDEEGNLKTVRYGRKVDPNRRRNRRMNNKTSIDMSNLVTSTSDTQNVSTTETKNKENEVIDNKSGSEVF